MITRIWFKIALLLALAVVPVSLLLLKLQTDSIDLVFSLARPSGVQTALDSYMDFLKESAKAAPEKEEIYRRHFQETLAVKRMQEEFFLAKDSLQSEIRSQTLLIVITALVFFLALSFLVSRRIVTQFRQLLVERQKAQEKLKDMSLLQQWQMTARMLVHELRSPMTPIKLVASDIEQKFADLPSEAFGAYLQKSQALVREQVEAVEKMVRGFTKFGALPPPQPEWIKVKDLLESFAAVYGKSFSEEVRIIVDTVATNCEEIFKVDPKLMKDLLFNLCKNAVEANHGKTTITLSARAVQHMVHIHVHNSGKEIPPDVAPRIFEPYVSAGMKKGLGNMGLGLTISRKIALDHGGDLYLKENDADNGVLFVVEIPLNQSSQVKDIL